MTPTQPVAYLVFAVYPSNDPELTCVYCGERGCDLEVTVRVTVDRHWSGLHTRCVPPLQSQNRTP